MSGKASRWFPPRAYMTDKLRRCILAVFLSAKLLLHFTLTEKKKGRGIETVKSWTWWWLESEY